MAGTHLPITGPRKPAEAMSAAGMISSTQGRATLISSGCTPSRPPPSSLHQSKRDWDRHGDPARSSLRAGGQPEQSTRGRKCEKPRSPERAGPDRSGGLLNGAAADRWTRGSDSVAKARAAEWMPRSSTVHACVAPVRCRRPAAFVSIDLRNVNALGLWIVSSPVRPAMRRLDLLKGLQSRHGKGPERLAIE